MFEAVTMFLNVLVVLFFLKKTATVYTVVTGESLICIKKFV